MASKPGFTNYQPCDVTVVKTREITFSLLGTSTASLCLNKSSYALFRGQFTQCLKITQGQYIWNFCQFLFFQPKCQDFECKIAFSIRLR